MAKALFGLVLLMGLGSCIVYTDDYSRCSEGAQRCYGELVEECRFDDWEVVADCWDLCGGTCDYDLAGRAVCIC